MNTSGQQKHLNNLGLSTVYGTRSVATYTSTVYGTRSVATYT